VPEMHACFQQLGHRFSRLYIFVHLALISLGDKKPASVKTPAFVVVRGVRAEINLTPNAIRVRR
jgi:hypothetical protein